MKPFLEWFKGQGRIRPPLAVALVLLALSASACGGPSAKERAAKRSVQVEYLVRGLTSREQGVARRVRAGEYASCRANIGNLIDALTQLNSRLDIGLTFSSYSDRLGNVRVAYDKVNFKSDSMLLPCLNAAAPAESAMNAYSAAYNIWNDCINNINCNTHSIDPQLQADWSKATPKVNSAVAALERVKTTGGRVPEVGGWTRVVPSSSAHVRQSIYGAASHDLCGGQAPVAAVEPCLHLRKVLAGGVTAGELNDLDKATQELNLAYHFAPAPSG